jgi:alkylated DNA repair protein (DNA oxidative demethylase)
MPTRGESTDIAGTVTATGKNPMKAAIEPEFGAQFSSAGTGLRGVGFYPGYLDRAGQERLVAAVRQIFAAAPLFTSRMPKSGRPMSVRMSNCGPLGWLSDARGYRYEPAHPETGRAWPPIPGTLIAIWNDIAQYPHVPEACLINFYGPDAKMGLHQDRDEQDFSAPVVSLSLGDSCLFRVGGKNRGDPTHSLRLNSGDVLVLAGEARLAFHGVDRIYPGTSTLLAEGGRINLTMRRVTRPADSRPRRAAQARQEQR